MLFRHLHYVPIVVKREDYVSATRENYIVEIVMQVANKLFPYIHQISHIKSMTIKYGEVINGIP
ncbi:MAG: hypothetical protein WCL18_10445 [bacterium]